MFLIKKINIMKTGEIKKIAGACFMAAVLLLSVNVDAQTRKLPDGSVIYSDGTRKLPNGTVVYKNATHVNNRGGGNMIVPNGNVRYPNGDDNRKNHSFGNARHLPPGQAKKMYGGNASDYAPGQQQNRKEHYDGEKHDDDHHNSEKQGKGHRDRD